MKSSNSKSATPEDLVHGLEAMRDAAVRLSLAMADFQFCAETTRRAAIEKEVRAVINRVQATLA
jgi:hypothetical protein